MSKQYRLLITAGLMTLPCLILAALVWLKPAPQPFVPFVPMEKFDRIEEGMTETEVEAILGQPGTFDSIHPLPGEKEPQRWMVWRVDERLWAVMGFQHDRVSTGTSWWHDREEATTLDRIRRWLQLD